jgi:SCP-2 sterol transfer family protein
MTMGEATSDFFEGLGSRGHEPLLETTTGTLRFDLLNGNKTERWLVSIDHGNVDVSHKNVTADCNVRATKELFDRVVTGDANAFAATLRGELVVEGDTRLLVRFQRLLPGPPRGVSPRSRPASRRSKR